MILTLGLSILIGLLLGLLGGGGSILTVPMLVYVLSVEPKTAIVTSFVVVGISSLMAIVQHALKHHVCWKSGLFFGLSGMAGAFGGGRAAAYFSGDVLMALFGLVTLLTGIAMLRSRDAEIHRSAPEEQEAICPAEVPYRRVLFDGFFVGGLTGLVGVGGGFLIVPALTLLVGLPLRAAVGTSLLVVAMNAAAGLGGYASHVPIDLSLTAIVTAGTIAGSVMGAWLSPRIGANPLRRAFGFLVVSVASYVLYRSLTAQLLADVVDTLQRHLEFVLGMAALAAALLFCRIGAWIHRHDAQDSGSGNERRR
ncbi:MAG TPA: sulfite exporter TauE/SafE family protein [Methylococcaceae bacterium]|nr:sulfite exporter TauE/SafE family protein [Methylococcaceae bacterium]